jgi:hypothetical protein
MKIKLSKSRWNFIGRKAGWIKKANDLRVVNKTDSIEIDDNSIREYENWLTEVLSNLKNITVQEDGNWYSSKPIIIDSFEYKNTGLPDYLNDFALLVNGIMKFHVNRTDISLNANIRNLFSQIKKEIDRLDKERYIYEHFKNFGKHFRERNQKERKDERWKAIDDMFLFAKKHEIDLSKLNKKDFKGSCTKIYRILVNKLHPDKYLDKNKKIWAEKEFKILQQLWDKFKQVNEKDVFERIKKAINNIQWGLRRF